MPNCDICGRKLGTYYTFNNLNFCPECYVKVAETQATETDKEYWEIGLGEE